MAQAIRAQNTNNSAKDNEAWGKRIISFSLRPLPVVTLFIGVLFSWTCVFILGVMAGRSNSLEHAPVLPQVSTKVPEIPKDIHGDSIIDPADLHFQKNLTMRDRHDAASALRKSAQERPQNYPPAVAQEAKKPVPEETTAVQETPMVQNTPAAENAQYYDYIYQLGVFKEENVLKVDALRETLEGLGYRTRLQEKSGKLILFVVSRSQDHIEKEVEDIAHKLALGKPFLRQKKAVRPL